MRVSRAWAAGGAVVALALGAASIPWSLDPDRLLERMNGDLAPTGYHWERATSASLRIFPQPILDIFGLRLADASGAIVFRASTAAVRLSVPSLLSGRYAIVRARLKEPMGEVDLDAFAAALPSLMASSPPVFLQARGGQLHLRSKQFGVDETVSPINASLSWKGEEGPSHVVFGGVVHGQWATLDTTIDRPREFVAGRASDIKLSVVASSAQVSIDGAATLGGLPNFTGRLEAKADLLADAASWLGLDVANFPAAEGSISGKVSLAPGSASFDDGRLSFRGQSLEGSIGLQREAGAWTASATLAADQLDLTPLFGAPPRLTDEFGRWSHAPLIPSLPPIALDMRVSAAALNWGAANLSDVAVTVTRRNDELTLKALEGTYAGGSINGEVIVKDCAERCSTRATLTLANADMASLTSAFGKKFTTGLGTADLDISASGASPAELVRTAEGELALTIRDGELIGVNFEEALRRGQRRALDVSRDLLVGQTPFRKLEGKIYLADRVATCNDLRQSGPGVVIAGSGAIDIGDELLEARVEARQADALGHLSLEGASLGLNLMGPWRRPTLTVQSSTN